MSSKIVEKVDAFWTYQLYTSPCNTISGALQQPTSHLVATVAPTFGLYHHHPPL
jgi:hypothetical protein